MRDPRRAEIQGLEFSEEKGGLVMHTRPPEFTATLQPTAQPTAELDRLGDQIAELSAHVDAATARLLALIREFDDRGGWNTGFRSCAEWLTWRVGLAPGSARERVRVARALGSLPAHDGGSRARSTLLCQGPCVDPHRDPGDRGPAACGSACRHSGPRGAHRAGLAPGRPAGGGPQIRAPACGPRGARPHG